jgi:uncharacterized protein YebE (UPF0316 family)
MGALVSLLYDPAALFRAWLQTAGPLPGWLGLPAAALPWLIFGLRATDQTIATVRTLVTVLGERRLAWGLGFIQSLLFISAVSAVLGSLAAPINLAAYGAGYATGQVLGIMVENRLARGHSQLRIISPTRAQAIVDGLRQRGWGVTELPAQGMAGTVSVVLCTVPRRDGAAAQAVVLEADPQAFVSAQSVVLLGGGWQL